MVKEKLTQHMIDCGEREHGSKCPIAMFFQREFNTHDVFVDVDFPEPATPALFLKVNDKFIVVKHPKKLIDFIMRFDEGKPVKPFFIEYEPS